MDQKVWVALEITAINLVHNVKVKITESENVDGIAPLNNVYKYANIETSSLLNSGIKEIAHIFKIPKELTVNKEVSLHVYENGKWIKLTTNKVLEDKDFSYYKSSYEHLSLFAITIVDKEKKVELIKEETAVVNETIGAETQNVVQLIKLGIERYSTLALLIISAVILSSAIFFTIRYNLFRRYKKLDAKKLKIRPRVVLPKLVNVKQKVNAVAKYSLLTNLLREILLEIYSIAANSAKFVKARIKKYLQRLSKHSYNLYRETKSQVKLFITSIKHRIIHTVTKLVRKSTRITLKRYQQTTSYFSTIKHNLVHNIVKRRRKITRITFTLIHKFVVIKSKGTRKTVRQYQKAKSYIDLLNNGLKYYISKPYIQLIKVYGRNKEQYEELSVLVKPYINYYKGQVSAFLHSSRVYKKIKYQTKKYLRLTRLIFRKSLHKRYTKAEKRINLLEKVKNILEGWILNRSKALMAFMAKIRYHKVQSDESFASITRKHRRYDNMIREHNLRLTEIETLLLELEESPQPNVKKKKRK